ncbi:MAG: OmpA family protein [Lachnospiraceae bacterium]|jgi:chemotaxis protein MotB|nr:OmpA family protein [Lachnospiraceae bacterium]
MSRRKKGGGGGEDCGSWMDTYGDMVTLLLCFFVMLYSMSSLDQQKWEIFVKSVFPNSNEKEQIAINENILDGEFDVSGNLQMDEEIEMDDLDKLWIALQKKLEESGLDQGATMSKGEGYAFISFENHTFFNGNSSQLTNEAIAVLDAFCEAIEPQADAFSQIEIMGHTAQGDPNHPNNPRTDRLLSSMRAAEVAAYIQEKNIMDPSKIIGISYGQFRPVDTFETSEGRAKNRRVEFLIINNGADIKSMNDFYDEINGVEKEDTSAPDGFTEVGGSMEGSASMVNQPDDTAAQGAADPAEAGNAILDRMINSPAE